MECRPEMGRPSAGAYWLPPAMPVAVLLLLLWLIGLWFIRLDWFGIGLWFWFWFGDTVVERMTRGIRWREWKETHGKLFWFSHTTLSGALVALPHLLSSRRHSMLIAWIAAHIYFVWSPDLTAHFGLVVCVVGRWISAFTRARRSRASAPSVGTYNHAAAPAYARAHTLSVCKPDYGRSARRRVPEHTPHNTSPLPSVQVQDSSSSSDRGSTTDYSLPAIIRMRTLQTRQQASHPFSSLVGVWAVQGPLGWAVVWVVLVRGGGVRLGAPVRD
ncbi:hypothetical protein DFH08DRAFT_940145 [Mycena albidolilacea]|uniref:Uncharacterized protein n=1 Tax=Mycena albidolilacea TaxID=1033008 RepID=A0AAD6ZNX0_9AGAR|nr:hypothetical protein DFH08DRAFT_940145 [Mycena albidolilacea]